MGAEFSKLTLTIISRAAFGVAALRGHYEDIGEILSTNIEWFVRGGILPGACCTKPVGWWWW